MKKIQSEVWKAERGSFNSLVNLLPQTVIEIGLDGTLLFANRHAFKEFRFNRNEKIAGKLNVFDFIDPLNRNRILQGMALLVKGRETEPREMTAIRRDGTTFPAIIYGNLILRDKMPAGVRAIIVNITEQKKAEEAYHALVQNSLQGLVIIQDGKMVFANDPFIRMSGYTMKRLCAFSCGDITKLIHPDDLEAVRSRYDSVLGGSHGNVTMKCRVFEKGQGIRWVETVMTRIECGGKPAIQAAVMEITEKERAEKSLRESERKYRDLAELLPQGLFESDAEGRITYANPSTLATFGYHQKDIEKGIKVVDTVVPEDRKRTLKAFNRIMKGELVTAAEYTCLRKDKSRFPALILANAIMKDDHPEGIRGFVMDISSQKQMILKLEESESRYRTLFESTGTATILIEDNMMISIANKEFYRLSGYSPEEEIEWPNLIHEEDRSLMMNYHRRRRGDPSSVPRSYEFRYVRRDGEVRTAFVNTAMIPGTRRSIASLVDITELKKTEADLKKHRQQLEVKTQNLEEANAALRVLLKHREEDRVDLEERIAANIRELVLPYLEKLKESRLNDVQVHHLEILETNLTDILSPFLRNLSAKFPNLTPREIQIIHFIKEGRSTKDISRLLNASTRTIDFHRNNIRQKLGIKNRKANLRSFLLSHP
jgi:PAS domain S-box-containing protein